MIALIASPLARYAALAAVCGGLALWGMAERAGRFAAAADAREARAEVASLTARIRNMEARNAVDRDVARNPDPAGELRREWSRPD